MARIRSVHPGLFTDEAFVSCSALGRLLLIGLWTECDDQGVFEWKPLQLKMRLLAADAIDPAALLEELADQKLIMRFEVNGRAYGAARNFLRYQRPKSPKPVFPVTPEAMEYVTGNRHASDVTEGPEPLDFPTDLTAAERKRRQREREKAANRDQGGISHGSSVTSTPMSRQMEDGGYNPPTPRKNTNGHARLSKQEAEAAFDRFWEAYPRHETKAKAREKLELILKRHEATADQLASAAASYARRMAAEGRPREKIAHPTTWLNQKRWEDEAEFAAEQTFTKPEGMSDERWAELRELARQRQQEREH